MPRSLTAIGDMHHAVDEAGDTILIELTGYHFFFVSQILDYIPKRNSWLTDDLEG